MKSAMTAGGEIIYKYDISGTFSESMELQSFPFDIQSLSLQLSSSISSKHVVLENLCSTKSVLNIANFAESNVYKISERIRFEKGETSLACSTSGTVRPSLRISILVRRLPSYYVWNVMVPLVIISGMTLTTFAVYAADIADRLGIR